MLTTRCPHCSTQFRVRPEQLSLRGGRVRCGHCQQAFSALAHLEELAEATPADAPGLSSAPVAAPAGAAPEAAREASQDASQDTSQDTSFPAPEFDVAPPPVVEPALPAFEPAPDFRADAEPAEEDFTAHLHLDGPSPAEVRAEREPEPVAEPEFRLDFTSLEGVPETQPTAAGARLDTGALPLADGEGRVEPAVAVFAPPYVSRVAQELGVEPYAPARDEGFGQTVMLEEPIMPAAAVAAGSASERGPESLFDARQQQINTPRVEDRRVRHTGRWVAGSLLLVLAAAAQLVFVFRTEIAREQPALRDRLEQACAALGCEVPYPRDGIAELKIEGSEFSPEAGGNNRFRLVATIANRARYAQAWPSIELTVTDRFDIAVARRVFGPQEWVPDDYRRLPAFAADSEITTNLAFDLDKLPAAGYRLYVFYP
ncbi:MAG: DUF3426 domain-containing protein [Candidatus Dactylopiibacterium sp.]|nr:DUF3426 domain-containing protein [Candidatus Dactylopiibacterium sp.]